MMTQLPSVMELMVSTAQPKDRKQLVASLSPRNEPHLPLLIPRVLSTTSLPSAIAYGRKLLTHLICSIEETPISAGFSLVPSNNSNQNLHLNLNHNATATSLGAPAVVYPQHQGLQSHRGAGGQSGIPGSRNGPVYIQQRRLTEPTTVYEVPTHGHHHLVGHKPVGVHQAMVYPQVGPNVAHFNQDYRPNFQAPASSGSGSATPGSDIGSRSTSANVLPYAQNPPYIYPEYFPPVVYSSLLPSVGVYPGQIPPGQIPPGQIPPGPHQAPPPLPHLPHHPHHHHGPYSVSTPPGMLHAHAGSHGPTTATHLPCRDENNALVNKRRIIKRRTRTGCLTCRKRRIKCDERKPHCFNCERLRKVCLGYEVVKKKSTSDSSDET